MPGAPLPIRSARPDARAALRRRLRLRVRKERRGGDQERRRAAARGAPVYDVRGDGPAPARDGGRLAGEGGGFRGAGSQVTGPSSPSRYPPPESM